MQATSRAATRILSTITNRTKTFRRWRVDGRWVQHVKGAPCRWVREGSTKNRAGHVSAKGWKLRQHQLMHSGSCVVSLAINRVCSPLGEWTNAEGSTSFICTL